MTSPVFSLCSSLVGQMSGASQFSIFFDDDRRRRILRSVFEAYYADVPPDGTVFDTNRIWTGRMALLADLYPTSRIICCVRDIGWILNSVERALRKNPMHLSRLNYIYAKKNDEQLWVLVYMGHGNLSLLCTDAALSDCIRAKGATHVHARLNKVEDVRIAELRDLLTRYENAFPPDGCNKSLNDEGLREIERQG